MWCCSVFTDVSMVIRCYVSVSGDVYGVALWSSGVMCMCVVMCVVLLCGHPVLCVCER